MPAPRMNTRMITATSKHLNGNSKGTSNPFTVIRRGRAPLLALVAALGYSHASFVRFTAGEEGVG